MAGRRSAPPQPPSIAATAFVEREGAEHDTKTQEDYIVTNHTIWHDGTDVLIHYSLTPRSFHNLPVSALAPANSYDLAFSLQLRKVLLHSSH